MANSPLLGGERVPERPKGTGTKDLGPSDSSDSGSDLAGSPRAGGDLGDADLDSDTDASGTGERAEAGRDTQRRDAPDLMPDDVVGPGSQEAVVPGGRQAARRNTRESTEKPGGVSESDKSIDS